MRRLTAHSLARCSPPRRAATMLLVWLAFLAVGCAPTHVPLGTLTPASARVTNATAAADAATFAVWADRLAAVRTTAASGDRAAAAAAAGAWLRYAQDLYAIDRRHPMIDTAFARAREQIRALEHGLAPAAAGPRAPSPVRASTGTPTAVAWPAAGSDADGALPVLLARIARGDTLAVRSTSWMGTPLAGSALICPIASPAARLLTRFAARTAHRVPAVAVDRPAPALRLAPAMAPRLAAVPSVAPPRATFTIFFWAVYFELNADRLDAAGRATLDSAAVAIAADPGIDRLVVGGYADPRGAVAYNLALSRRRAERVADYLRAKGLTVPIDVRAFGAASEPSGGNDEAAYAVERRVEIRKVTGASRSSHVPHAKGGETPDAL